MYTISWRQQQSHLNPLTSPALSSGLRCARRHALEADAFTNPQMSLGQIETFLATTSKRWSIVSKSSEKASLTPVQLLLKNIWIEGEILSHLSPHLALLVLQPLLLVADDGAGAADPQPSDHLHSRPAPVFHHVTTWQNVLFE